jgi:hypothetical protein
MKSLNVRSVYSVILMFIFSRISLKVSLAVAKTLTVVFRVFDWDMFKDSDNIGEVTENKLVRKNKQFCSARHKFHCGSLISQL